MKRPYENVDLEPIFQVLEDIIQEDLDKATKKKRWEWARALEAALKPIPIVGKVVGLQKSIREVIACLKGNDHIDMQIVAKMIGKDLMNEFHQRQQNILATIDKQDIHHKQHTKTLQEIKKLLQSQRAQKMTPERERVILKKYLDKIIAATCRIDIQGIGSKPGAGHEALTFPIEELYTPLKTVNPKMKVRQTKNKEQLSFSELQDGGSSSPLTDLLSDTNRLLIIGQPGGGKTTFLRLIACVLAKDYLHEGNEEHEPSRKKHLGLPLSKPAPIPILLKISTISRLIEDKELVDLECGAQWCRIKRDLENSYGKEEAAVLEKYLDEKKCALLLDGLDEVADEDQRKKIVDTVRSVLQRWGDNLIFVSSRPYGYQAVSGLEEVQPARIMKFGEDEIRQFIEHWDRGLPEKKHTETGLPYKDALEKAILSDKNIQELASNPVMLTCLCVVHWNEQELPKGKANLLAAVLRWLLNAREPKRNKRGDDGEFVNEGFKRLALAMTNHDKGKQVDTEVAWAAQQLEKTYEEELGMTNRDKARRRAKQLLEAETIDSGIIEQSEIGLRFWHLTFQEHYAAKALLDKSESEWWPIVEAHLGDQQWSETIDQLAGSLAAEKNRSGLRRFLNRVIQTATENDLKKTVVAVSVVHRLLRLLVVYKFNLPPSDDWKRVLIWAQHVFTIEGANQVPIEWRLPAAEAIGRESDRRFKLLEPNMLLIPRMEQVQLSTYPVTVLEYSAFVEDGGYFEPRYWEKDWKLREEKSWSTPGNWEDQTKHPTWPITGVSWFEAMAYCRWLSEKADVCYRLPKEAEWEKTTIHPDGGDYPWGTEEPNKELLNFDLNVGHATPVGIYPAGAGFGGHLDLSGNVWEWCGDGSGKKEMFRVVRGGCWDDGADDVRASLRLWSLPDARLNDLGFRICRD